MHFKLFFTIMSGASSMNGSRWGIYKLANYWRSTSRATFPPLRAEPDRLHQIIPSLFRSLRNHATHHLYRDLHPFWNHIHITFVPSFSKRKNDAHLHSFIKVSPCVPITITGNNLGWSTNSWLIIINMYIVTILHIYISKNFYFSKNKIKEP